MAKEIGQLNLFDYEYDENGMTAYDKRVERAKKQISHPYTDLIKGYEDNTDFCLIANLFMGYGVQWEYESVADIQKAIQKIVDTKTYHYGNFNKNIYVYSFKIDNEYRLYTETNDYIVSEDKYFENINKVLLGKELIQYPACAVSIFNSKGEQLNVLDNGTDLREKVIEQELSVCEYSTNRIHENEKPTTFYECAYQLPDFISYMGECEI